MAFAMPLFFMCLARQQTSRLHIYFPIRSNAKGVGPMPSQGTIVARAYTSTAIIPVEGATVRITNANGMTASLAVQTPSASESQQPGTVHPFTEVDILCEHPLFERIFVEHVQIFAGIESVQNLVMIPLQAYPDHHAQTEIFEISPQNL